jgi:hypothetical protein
VFLLDYPVDLDLERPAANTVADGRRGEQVCHARGDSAAAARPPAPEWVDVMDARSPNRQRSDAPASHRRLEAALEDPPPPHRHRLSVAQVAERVPPPLPPCPPARAVLAPSRQGRVPTA